MALKSTIFKADLQIADMDRNYYQSHSLTLARHPSETDERMMARLLAFALNGSEALSFGKGLSTDDEPDLWQKDLTGAVEIWIDVGLPDERRLRRACGRADQVLVYAYGGRATDVWWNQNRNKLETLDNLQVAALPYGESQALAGLAARTMSLQCTVQDGLVWLGDNTDTVQVNLAILKPFSSPAK